MKKSVFVVFYFALFVFAACKKNNPSPPPGVYYRVSSVYDDTSHLTSIYYYSPANLLNSYSNDSGKNSYSFNYLAGQSVEQVYLNSALAYKVVYFWNDKSLVDSSFTSNTSLSAIINKKYTYDNNNFLINVKWYNYQNTAVLVENFTIANGNVSQHTYTVLDTGNMALPSGSYTYTYNTGLINTLGNNYYGQVYLGVSSKNPPASCTYTNAAGSATVNYRYNYSGGNISSELIYVDSAGLNGARVDSLNFSYYD